MRKLYIVFLFAFLPSVAIIAQPSIFIGDGPTVCTGEQLCLPVTTSDFSDIITMECSFSYDPAVLAFSHAQNFNPNLASGTSLGNLGAGLFSVTEPGQISFATWGWDDGNCDNPANNGQSIDDFEVLFELCFDAIGTYGETSEVNITNVPTPINLTRQSTGCSPIGLLVRQSSTVTLCVRELNISATDVSGNEGDLVCVDFPVTGFDQLSNVQFSVNYDPAFLTFVNLIPNTDLPSNFPSIYNPSIDQNPPVPETAGAISVAWTHSIPGSDNASFPDGESMFTACFTITGACENTSEITFSGRPTLVEASNVDPDNPDESLNIPVGFNTGTVTVNDCDPTGLEIVIDCGAPVEINDEFCVDFSAGANFQSVRDMLYLMQWNPSILEFVQVIDPNSLAQLSSADFDISNVDNGILGIDWSVIGQSQNLNNGEVIYSVCFRVIGLGGDSPISIVPPGMASVNGSNLDINSSNCVVEVIQPASIGINFGDIGVPLNSNGCVPITVTSFNDVTSMAFTMQWDETSWSFTGVANVHPFINGASFNPFGASSYIFDWTDNGGVTLPNDAVLFEMCFDAIGDPDICNILTTVSLPTAEQATTIGSVDENVGLVVNNGELCVLFPEGFGLEAVSTTIGWKDTICMNFTVESFDNIIDADFFVYFDPTALDFVSATPIGWTGLTFVPPTPPGTIEAHFQNATPVVLADGEVAFEVCFIAKGDPNQCYDVTIEDDPNEALLTTVGEGSIVVTDGEICVEDQIVIESIEVIPASCPDVCDGSVQITVSTYEGQGFIGTTWETEPFPQFIPLALDGLCATDSLCFTIFDNDSGVNLRQCVEIPVSGTIPVAEIEGDSVRALGCDPSLIVLSAVNQGDGVGYAWYLNTLQSGNVGTLTTFIAGPSAGNYILEVVDNVSGCSSTDTVSVMPPTFPEAEAGDSPMPGITCANESVILNGSGVGENLSFRWELSSGDGANIDSTTINTANLRVTGIGTYRLIVRDAITGCEAIDSVTVTDDRIFPNACLNPGEEGGDLSLEQNCDGIASVFDATCSGNDGLAVTYAWFNEDFMPTGGIGITDSFTELGTYPLIITESSTGCSDTVYAHVIPNMSAPVLTLDEVGAIDCNNESITLNATVTPDGIPLDTLWTLTNGASFMNGTENSLMPTAITAGTYTLLITNTDNNCEATASVIIEDQTALPIASIAEGSGVISCADTNPVLDGSASSQGDTIVYNWYLNTIDDASIGNADTLVISEEGAYILEVINQTTGCTALDTVMATSQVAMPAVTLDVLEGVLDCENTTLTVTASVDVDNFTLQGWTVTEGGNITVFSMDSLTITVDSAGIYNVSIINDMNGCIGEADLVVTENFDLPDAVVTTDTAYINCTSPSVTISGQGSSTGTNFTYIWENLDGEQPPVADQLDIDVTEAGTYQLTVLNFDNACVNDTTIVVVTDTIKPMGVIAPVDDITCLDMSRVLTVSVTNAEEFMIEWSGDPTAPLSTSGEMATIGAIGTYQAVITNTENACQDSVSITVMGDVEEPVIDLGELPEFDCADLMQTIDASGSGANDDFVITWTPSTGAGTVTPPSDNLVVTVDNIGEYTLTLLSLANGCSADSTFTISTVEQLTLPVITIAELDSIGCDGAAVVIDATATDDGSIASTIWGDGVTDLGPFMGSVTEAGDYMFTAIATGVLECTTTDTITVAQDESTPMATIANEGGTQTLMCGEVGGLDANASTPASATFVYEWIATGGGVLGGDLTGATPTIIETGMFQLVIMNTENGCTDTSGIVTVMLQLPDPADAGADMAACDDTVDLNAVAVAGTQGAWTTTSGAIIDMPNDPATTISGLSGASTFVWTLSAPSCPDYSADSVTITPVTGITANDDALVIEGEARDGSVNIIENDLLTSGAFSINVLTPPSFGTIDTVALNTGTFSLSLGTTDVGTTEMVYQICSVDCPNLCDTATVNINVTFDGEFMVPNGFTPNDDGVNDVFVFDILNFEEAPDNELIIFSRWGDIIYQAKPYNNDWTGLNLNGEPVPEATYYFVLRVDIGQGKIIRGDVTVIR